MIKMSPHFRDNLDYTRSKFQGTIQQILFSQSTRFRFRYVGTDRGQGIAIGSWRSPKGQVTIICATFWVLIG